jgi:hypothetical protein
MEPLYRCCAGLDVHKDTVVACVRRLGEGGRAREQVRTFATMTGALLALADWLAEEGVTHAALESTGVYWKPVYHLLRSFPPTGHRPAGTRLLDLPGRK